MREKNNTLESNSLKVLEQKEKCLIEHKNLRIDNHRMKRYLNMECNKYGKKYPENTIHFFDQFTVWIYNDNVFLFY